MLYQRDYREVKSRYVLTPNQLHLQTLTASFADKLKSPQNSTGTYTTPHQQCIAFHYCHKKYDDSKNPSTRETATLEAQTLVFCAQQTISTGNK